MKKEIKEKNPKNEKKLKQEKNNYTFLIVIFALILILVLFLPKIYNFIENSKLPKIKQEEKNTGEIVKEVDKDILDSLHYPMMRNSVYDINTYYSLDVFKVSNMSNNDILYNAFMDIYEGNMTSSDVKGSCTTISKQFNKDYMELRIKNILGKNINYTLDTFYVPEDSNSNYKGTWQYDNLNSRFIYNGLCSSKVTNTKYYNLEQFINAAYEEDDIIVNYYVGFAKVIDNNYIIYSDYNMTQELANGNFTSLEDLNNVFKSLNKKDKKIYKYTFKNTLCSYNEYCLYEGKWINEL